MIGKNTASESTQAIRLSPTVRLYLEDDYCFEADANSVAVRDDSIAFDQTCFYPGGGGQPPDEGSILFDSGAVHDVVSARSDTGGVIWHTCKPSVPLEILEHPVRLTLNKDRRLTLMRYHTVLHVLNTIVLKDHDGWITGVQMAVDYSRIDFKIDGFSAEMRSEMEADVNIILQGNHLLKSYYLSEEEFRKRDDLLRTMEARPPILNGQVRIVEIQGFDAQACGGTHVRNTSEVGRFSIFRTENKGKNNKRLYVRLE